MADKDDTCKVILEMEVVKCPECGAGEDELDFYVSTTDGLWHWNCFSCGHDWCSPSMEPELDEADEKEEE